MIRPTLLIALVAALGCGDDARKGKPDRGPVAVAVAPVQVGSIELRRGFTGTVRSKGSFVVAAHVAGRVQKLLVDLSDPVKRGQVVAELDDSEQVQGVSQAYAELGVARARLSQARAEQVLAKRELERTQGLFKAGAVAVSDVDRVRAQYLAAATAVKVARATLRRMGSGLQGAKIRSDYNRVVAAWSSKDRVRVVARRHVSVGDRVMAGQPIFTVVDLEPIQVIVNVGEKDYASIRSQQPAVVTTDALADKEIAGTITRVAPVFSEASRQARVEVEVANADHLLKPGMFVRVRVVLRREENVVIVPFAALTSRAGASGVFVLDEAGNTVHWRPVEVGIREGERVQVTGEGVTGRVVTLGQQLVRDGSPVTVPAADDPSSKPVKSARSDKSE